MNRLQFGKLMTRLFNTNPSPSFESTSVSLRRDLASMLQAGAEDDSFYRKLGKNADGTVRRDAASAQDPAANGSGNAVPQEVNQSDQPPLESGSSDPAVPCAAAIAGGAAAAQELAAYGADAPCESSSIRPATTAVVRTSGQGNLHKKKPPSKKDCWKQKGKRTTFARPKNKSSEPIPIRTRPPNAPGARCDYQIALGEGLPNPIFDQVG